MKQMLFLRFDASEPDWRRRKPKPSKKIQSPGEEKSSPRRFWE